MGLYRHRKLIVVGPIGPDEVDPRNVMSGATPVERGYVVATLKGDLHEGAPDEVRRVTLLMTAN